MAQESPSEADQDDSDTEPQFVEVDPSGRYGRYKEVLGKGAFKKVYRAFDELEGIEVAWNQVKVSEFLGNSMDLDRLYAEVHLLKTLKHKNIIKFYHSWVDSKNEQINFITEIFTSGNLRQYRKKHKNVDLRALKKWSRQILEGLLYLHSHDPPVIHRDLKCDNIFVNGNQGEVKIGDLGLAAILLISRSAHSVLGTPEFMAPEFYKEEYNELVDIYAFGMCLLELVTLEYPYVECTNAAQIYRKVTLGIKPASLEKVKNPEVRAFIEKCIADVTERLSAEELLMDPFLQPDEDSLSRGRSIQPQSSCSDENVSPSHTHRDSHDFVPEAGRDFTVQGQRKDQNIIFLKLRIVDSSGHIRNIHFPFDIEVDTPTNVASEMVEELNLTDHDVSVIAAMIDSEIRSHIPDWAPREQFSRVDGFDSNANTEESGDSQKLDANSPRAPDSPQCSPLLLERMPSGRKYWSDSPKASGGNSPLRHGPSNLMQTDSACSQDSWSEENSHSPISRKDAYVSSPLRRVDNDSSLDPFQNPEAGEPLGQVDGGEDVSGNDGLEENAGPSDNVADEIKNVVEKLENLLVEANRVENVTEHGPLTIEDDVTDRIKNVVEKLEHLSVGIDNSENVSVSIPLEENTVPSDSASDEISDTVEKLENLLNEQQLELYAIRKKHELAVSDLLKDYSLEVREKVLSLCKLKVNNEQRNSTIPYLSRASSITDEATRRSFVERSLFGPVSRFSFKHLKYRVGSDFGIAVILKDDEAEL